MELKNYIGCKVIKATPMTLSAFNLFKGRTLTEKDEEGYCVIYPDGYVSWTPVKAFEAYREISAEELEFLQTERTKV